MLVNISCNPIESIEDLCRKANLLKTYSLKRFDGGGGSESWNVYLWFEDFKYLNINNLLFLKYDEELSINEKVEEMQKIIIFELSCVKVV